MRVCKNNWLLLLFFVLPVLGYSHPADSTITIVTPKDFYPVNLATSILMDSTASETINTVREKTNTFHRITDEILNFITLKKCPVLWVKTAINNQSGSTLDYLLYFHPGLDTLELYYYMPDGSVEHQRYSSYESTRKKPYFISQEIVAPITLKQGFTAVYLKVVNRSTWSNEMGSLIIGLAEKQPFLNYFMEFRFYQGLALGMLFLLLIFHFFIYFFLKDKTYLVFLINLFFTLLYLLLRKNYQLEFDVLQPTFSILPYLHDPFCFFISITSIWFSQLFLNLKTKDPLFNGIMSGLIWLQLAVVVFGLGFQQLKLMNALSIYLSFFSAIIVILASIRSFLAGNRLALYVFFGFLLLALVPIVYIIPIPNYLHYKSSESDLHYFGEAIRAMIFAVGITDRIYQLRKEVTRQQLEKKQLLLDQTKLLQAERERISRDLHDNIGSLLAMLSLELGLLSRQQNEHNEKIELVKESTKTVISQLRDTVWILEKEMVTIASLEEKLSAMLLPQRRALKIEFALQVPAAIRALELTPNQAINTFRIIQEALQNSIKHSQCSLIKININLNENTKQFLVQLSDDGEGFETGGVTHDSEMHYGLKNMNKRAAEINGKLELISTPKKGTTVSLYFPMA